MSKEFYIVLNLRELNALMGIDAKVVAAYNFIKRNMDFNTGKTKHICYGALAVYLGNMDRTQAKRLIQKMLKIGLIQSTDTKQIFTLGFSGDTQNDTITIDNTINNKINSTKLSNSETNQPDLKNNLIEEKDNGSHTAPDRPKIVVSGVTPSQEKETPLLDAINKRGIEDLLTPLAKKIKAEAVKRGFLFATNEKSIPYYRSAAQKLESKGMILQENIDNLFNKVEKLGKNRPFDLCIELKSDEPNTRKAPGRGDLVL
jgi:hypothetical protein